MAQRLKPCPKRPDLDKLLDEARQRPPMTPAELREQRISFAYGNCAIDNPRITREMVEREHDRIYGAPPAKEPMETYIATLRPVSFCTLPEDIGRWEYAAQPETLDGGRYGIIRCRPLSKDEQSHFGLYRIDL